MDGQKNEKKRNRKDFLYKIGKLRENRMLNQKEDNDQFYCEHHQCEDRPNMEQIEDQMDFQLTVPCFEPVRQTAEVLQKVNQIQQPLSVITNNDISEVKVKQQTDEKIKQPEVQQAKTRQQKENNINHTPITFEDFDEQMLETQQREQQPAKNDQLQMDQHTNNIPGWQQENADVTSSCSEQDIKGVTIMSNSLQGNVIIKITNKKELVLSRLPPGIILKCIIRRSSDIFNPEFDFYLNNGLKHIISAKKYSLAKKEIFKLSLELGKYRDGDIIGSIMANTVHNTYWIYKQETRNQEIEHDIKGVVRFEKIVKNRDRPMVVDLYVDRIHEIKVATDKLTHQVQQKADLTLKNCPLTAKQSSTKNYILYDDEDKDYQYLKMKKVSDHMFEIQIQHPLSPLQAFAICLTRFDAELQ